MADKVQKLLEKTVDELQDLLERGIHTKNEVSAIVRKRRQYEYGLAKREVVLGDFTRYIHYEMTLDRLRALRRKKLGVKKMTKEDAACRRHLHFLYERMLRKFKGRVDLWMQYIEFSKRSDSTKVLGRAFAQALQLHPREPRIWIAAASWEFETNGNANAARVLMQVSGDIRGCRRYNEYPAY